VIGIDNLDLCRKALMTRDAVFQRMLEAFCKGFPAAHPHFATGGYDLHVWREQSR
jgi:hypothetical protein